MKCESCEHENIDGARFCAKCGAAIHIAVIGETDPLIGQVIAGRFHVTGVLGEGGMGVVYVGEQQMGTTVRKVAVKTLHQHLSKDSSVQARFNREVGTVAQLEHPNTIKVYDFGTTKDGQLYIAMEFVAGKSLADTLLSSGALSAERTVHIMRQICGALDEAHMQGIIHRDLKPDNIILTDRAGETDFVKVLDFGIAARTESADAQKEQKLTQQGMVLGTPPYMSPEQFTGKPLDSRSDVYSLGVMAYEMVTGKLPFDAETPWEWATQHMTVAPKSFEAVAPTAHIPEGLRQAILKALNKDRTQRQDSARQFFAELSGGGRMTVEARPVAAGAPAAAGAYQPTAAMPAAPAGAAAGGYAPTALQPQMPMPGGQPAASPITAPAVVAPAVAAVPPPPTRGGGSNKGLVLGLSGAALALVVVIIVVVISRAKPDDTAPITAPLGDTSSGPAVVSGEAPVINVPATSGSAAAEASAAKQSVGQVSGSGTKPRPATSQSAAATAAPTAAATTAPPATTPPAGAADPCAQCLAAAASGNIPGAKAAYDKCGDAAQKAACSGVVKRSAGNAAKAAARNQQCPAAKAIIAAANAMGASTPAINNALAGTSCTP